jgi:RNA polymerase sigma-70 factor (ECF subfamily)
MERCAELQARYEELWRQFGDCLFRLVSSYESAPQAREDLLQEIQLALWKAIPSFCGDCSLRTFVHRVAENRALTHVWRRRAEPLLCDDFKNVDDPAPTAEAATIREADHASLAKAIRRLPIVYRQVITMAPEELPQAEIAAVLGISENNVAVRLNRARKLLRQQLGEKR